MEKKFFKIDRIEKEIPFVNFAITTKEVNSKDINDLKSAFSNNEFTLDNLTSNIQVHSDIVNVIDKTNIKSKTEGDALITNLNKVPLLVFTADCVPVAIIDKEKRVIGVAHAGWKGTYSEIARKTIETMNKKYNSKYEDLVCIIGPAIGECCYEVSQDLFEKFDTKFNIINNSLGHISNSKYYLNLENINKFILKSTGVKCENIINLSMCTNCNKDKLHSYRAHNKTDKRIGTIIELI